MRYLFIPLLLIIALLSSCDQIQNSSSKYTGKYGEYAKQSFLEKMSYMTEREALSKEIGWYKEPQITDYSYYGDMTGRDIISICNKINAENERELAKLRAGRTWCAYSHNVGDIKEYALNHPDECIASKYHLAATFTTYSKENPYSNQSNDVIVVKGINKIIILSDNQNFVTFGISDFSPKWYE